MRSRTTCFLLVLALLLLGASGAYADSVSMVLTSSGNGDFYYALHQPGNTEVDFITGETITLSGLSDVTNALVSNTFFDVNFVATFTPTSVTLTLSPPTISVGSVTGSSAGSNTGYLEVFSSAPTGLVNYDIAAQLGSYDIAQQVQFIGSVEGPVTPAPEPASFVLLGSGLAGVWIARRKKKAVQ
jgi:PEP-CTERM motif